MHTPDDTPSSRFVEENKFLENLRRAKKAALFNQLKKDRFLALILELESLSLKIWENQQEADSDFNHLQEIIDSLRQMLPQKEI